MNVLGYTGQVAYNTSSSRYIHTSDAEIYCPIVESINGLKIIESETREPDKALKENLEEIGV